LFFSSRCYGFSVDFGNYQIKTPSAAGKKAFFFKKKVDFVCVGGTVTYPQKTQNN